MYINKFSDIIDDLYQLMRAQSRNYAGIKELLYQFYICIHAMSDVLCHLLKGLQLFANGVTMFIAGEKTWTYNTTKMIFEDFNESKVFNDRRLLNSIEDPINLCHLMR